MMTIQADKMDRIRKLIAKANGTTNAHEAAAFMNKAQQLMAESGATMEDVELSVIGEARVKSLMAVSKVNPAENVLMHGVAEAFGLANPLWIPSRSSATIDGIKYRYTGDTYARFVLIGPKDRLDLAVYAAEVLLRQLQKARSEYSTARSKKLWDACLQTASDDYEEACIKADAEIRRKIRQNVKESADSFAMGWAFEIQTKIIKFALNDKERLLLESYIKDVSGEAKSKNIELNHGYYDGVKAAKNANLHRPLDDGATTELLPMTKQLEAR